MTDIFISYAREDRAFVRRLHERLGELDRGAWVDWEDIPPTAEWMNEIYSAIEAADTFVIIISPDSLNSEVCRKEIAHAEKNNKRLIPLVCRDIDDMDVPDVLAKINWVFFRDIDDFETATNKLVDAIDTDLDWVRVHTRLLVRAREWEDKGQDKSFTLRGKDLYEAEKWMSQGGDKEPRPSALQTQYVMASRTVSDRRQRMFLVSLSVGLLISVALIILAIHQRNSAINARNEAEELISFMTNDLQEKLLYIGRIELMEDVNLAISRYQRKREGKRDIEALRTKAYHLKVEGALLASKGKYDEALDSLDKSRTIISQIASDNPNDFAWQIDLAWVLLKIGDINKMGGEFNRALSAYKKAFEGASKLAIKHPENLVYLDILASSHESMGDIFSALEQDSQSLDNYLMAKGYFEKLVSLAPENSGYKTQLADVLEGLSEIYLVLEKDQEALGSITRSVQVYQEAVNKEVGNTQLQGELAVKLYALGFYYVKTGRPDKAIPNLSKSIEIFEALLNYDPENIYWLSNIQGALLELGNTYSTQEKPKYAIQFYESSLAYMEKILDIDPHYDDLDNDLGLILNNLGDAFHGHGDLLRAKHFYERCLAITEKREMSYDNESRWKFDLAVTHQNIVLSEDFSKPNSKVNALDHLKKARELLSGLGSNGELNEQEREEVVLIEKSMASIYNKEYAP